MNKKLFGTALLGLLLSAATGTFVSCKDYDDDIDNLQNQINNLSKLQSNVDGLKSELAGVQSTCQANLASAIADLKNGDVKKAIDAAAAAQATASEAAATAAAGVSAAQTAQGAADAAAAAAAAAQTAADAAKDLATVAQAAANAAQNTANDAATAAANAQNTANNALVLAQQAAEAAAAAKLTEDQVAALNSIATLAAKLASLEGLKGEILTEVDAKIAAAQLAGSAVDAALLQEIQDALAKLQEAAASIIGKRLTSLVFAPTDYINGIEAINFINLIYTDWSTDPKNWKNDVAPGWGKNGALVSGQVEDYGTYVEYLVSPAGVTMDGISALKYRLNYARNTRAKANDVTLTVVDSTLNDGKLVLGLKKTVTGKDTNLPEALLTKNAIIDMTGYMTSTYVYLYGDVNANVTVTNPDELWANWNFTEYAIPDPNEGDNNRYNGGFSDGWAEGSIWAGGNAWLNAWMNINNGQLQFYNAKLQNLTVNCNSTENLIIAALEAQLAEAVKDESEKGNEISVFSDWARLNETWEIPYIHNAKSMTNGAIDCKKWNSSTQNSHFWPFHAIYADGRNGSSDYRDAASIAAKKFGTDATYLYDRDYWRSNYFVAHEAVYDEDVNLYDLVKVCTKYYDPKTKKTEWSGKELTKAECEQYGLSFEFNLMDFFVKNEVEALDATNQKDFAKLSEDGILTSCAENGLDKNKDAIGRTPVIQVVLRDTKKTADPADDQIIDVKYFKIKWLAEAPQTVLYEDAPEFVYGFECNDYYSGAWIYEKWMNNFYATVVEGGFGKNEFYNKYNSISNVYAGVLSEAAIEAVNADPSANVVGSVQWRTDDWNGSTQTQNLEVTFWNVNLYFTDAKGNKTTMKPEADFDVDAFFWFEDSYGSSRIYVPVKLHVKAGSYYVRYAMSQFNDPKGNVYAGKGTPEEHEAMRQEADKYRNVNPILYSDPDKGNSKVASTQLVQSIPYGYLYDGKAPQYNWELLRFTYAEGTYQAEQVAAKKMSQPWVTSNVVFDADRIGTLPTINDKAHKDYVWFVYDDCKLLYYGIPHKNALDGIDGLTEGTVGARIDDATGEIYLIDQFWAQSTGQDMTAVEPTEAALQLVGQKVPVKVIGQHCDPVVVDKYFFNFIDPLYFEETSKREVLVDVTNGGSQTNIVIDDMLLLKENFGQNRNRIYIYKTTGIDVKKNQTLIDWYDVDVEHVGYGAPLTNLNVTGGKDDACVTPLNKILNPDGTQSYDVTIKLGEKVATDDNGNTIYTDVVKEVKEVTTDEVLTDDAGNKVQATDEKGYQGLKWTEGTNYVLAYNAGTADKPDYKPAYAVGGKYYDKPNGEGNEVTVATVEKSVKAWLDGTTLKQAFAKGGKWYSDETYTTEVEIAQVQKTDANGNKLYNADGTPQMEDATVKITVNAVTPELLPVWQYKTKQVVIYEPKMIPDNGSAVVYFHNMTGNAIAKGYEFDVDIPVTIDTKWHKGLKTFIKVTIKSGL